MYNYHVSNTYFSKVLSKYLHLSGAKIVILKALMLTVPSSSSNIGSFQSDLLSCFRLRV